MIRFLWNITLLVLLGLGFAWLADRPGDVTVEWLGREIRMSVMVAAIGLGLAFTALWLIARFTLRLWRSPRTAREYWRFRRHRKAYESLSRGLIAASAGDAQAAARLSAAASATLDNEPLVNVLAAQAAQLKGDRPAVKRAFEDMAKAPETEVLGLRGLFAEARQAGDFETAASHATRALSLNPRLAWASAALLQVQTARKDWAAAAATIQTQGRSGLLAKDDAAKRRAAFLTAEARRIEDENQGRALQLAAEAHGLDPSLVPAAAIAARCHIAQGSTRKAVRILRDTWLKFPHPDIADVLSRARPEDSPEGRFERVRDLVGDTTKNLESAVALARAAAAAQRWSVAREALQPWSAPAPQARVCALMAQIEDATGDKGRTREWLARALTAQRDPMWLSDGVACPQWTPVSPVTGEIVPCEWKTPFETLPAPEYEALDHPETSAAKPPPGDTARQIEAPRIAQPVRPPDDPGVPAEDRPR